MEPRDTRGRPRRGLGALAAALLALAGCGGTGERPPIPTVARVDLERFMGDWYVIASIPTFIEKDAYNAVESYRLAGEGRIDTTFTYREGGFDGEQKTWHPTGFVRDDESNAVWGMQFIWPIRAEYRIVYLDDAYSQTVIGRNARDYAWIMAREPSMPDTDYRRLVQFLGDQGYDVAAIRKVPQRWR